MWPRSWCAWAWACVFSLSLLQLPKAQPDSGATPVPVPPPDPPASSIPPFVSSPIRAKHERFLRNVIRILLKEGVFFNEPTTMSGPFRYRAPEVLSGILPTKLGENGATHGELLRSIRKVIRFSPHPSHPTMLSSSAGSGLDPYGLAADWLVSTINENGAIYYVGPVSTLLEMVIVRRLRGLFGWPANNVDGITTPGAGAANAMAFTLALQQYYPGLKEKGLPGVGNPKPAVFISEHASIAFEKAAATQGLASDWVIKVETNAETGRMSVRSLRRRILAVKAAGLAPFMVVGTAGTEILGAIDDLAALAEVCQQYGLWFHVDAGKGGPLIFHETLRSKLAGIERADSVTFGTAWMLATPYVTSILLVHGDGGGDGTSNGAGKLQEAFGTHAHYLFIPGVDLYNTSLYDRGDATVQASRRMEVLKLWYMWEARGSVGLGSLVENVHKNKEVFMKELQKRAPGFRTVIADPDLPQVTFYYVPKRYRLLNPEGTKFMARITQITAAVKLELLTQNLMQISTARLGGGDIPEFFVAPLTNTVLTQTDLKYILDLIAAAGEFKSLYPNIPYEPPAVVVAPPAMGEAPPSDPNSPLKGTHLRFFKEAFNLFLDKGIFFVRSESPFNFQTPEQLEVILELSAPSSSSVAPMTQDELLTSFGKAVEYSPHRGHPYFMYQLLGGFSPYTLAADWVASAMNTPMLTYEDSPVFTLMERDLLSALRARIFKSETGDGIIADGGSMANQMAIVAALHAKDPRVRVEGFGSKKFVGYMSEDAHYSSTKGFILQNLGSVNLVLVASNARGQMRPRALEAAIQKTFGEGGVPFFVCITTGTTVYGAIDPVSAIVALAAKYKLWAHVDGMVGGLLAMSDAHAGKLAGLERVDSFATDLHKLMGSTLTCAALITKRVGVFRETFEVPQNPETQSTAFYNREQWDTGAYHWQVDKRNNVFKFWLLWKAVGRLGFQGHVDVVMDNSAYLVQQLHKRGEGAGFKTALSSFEVTNVCFWYIPTNIRSLDQSSMEFAQKLGNVSMSLAKTLTLRRVLDVVAQQRLENSQPAFLKFVMMDSQLTKADIDYLLDAVAWHGEHLIT